MNARDLIVAAWVALAVVWAAGAVWRKPVVRRETPAARISHLGAAFVAAWLLSSHSDRPPLAWRLYPATLVVFVIAVICVWSGVGLAIWARLRLGRNWSGTVTIKDDHELVRGGPYAIVRHPIYTGILWAALGTALALGRVGGFVAVALFFLSFWHKSRREERFLREQFGAEWDRYREEVRAALVPLLL